MDLIATTLICAAFAIAYTATRRRRQRQRQINQMLADAEAEVERGRREHQAFMNGLGHDPTLTGFAYGPAPKVKPTSPLPAPSSDFAEDEALARINVVAMRIGMPVRKPAGKLKQ